MGDLINYFDYVYLEVNRDYVYKNCALVHEIDEYLSNFQTFYLFYQNDMLHLNKVGYALLTKSIKEQL